MKYKVLKEFVSPAGVLVTPDTAPIDDLSYPMMTEALLKGGFIEGIKDEPWTPKEGDRYWVICENGDVEFTYAEGKAGTKSRVAIGNCFQAKKEAEKATEWLKAFNVIRVDTKGFKPNWGDVRQAKWTAEYNHETHKLNVYWASLVSSGVPYFESEEDIRKSIKDHEKAWLIFLGIEQ